MKFNKKSRKINRQVNVKIFMNTVYRKKILKRLSTSFWRWRFFMNTMYRKKIPEKIEYIILALAPTPKLYTQSFQKFSFSVHRVHKKYYIHLSVNLSWIFVKFHETFSKFQVNSSTDGGLIFTRIKRKSTQLLQPLIVGHAQSPAHVTLTYFVLIGCQWRI